jgi:hypothetical protein
VKFYFEQLNRALTEPDPSKIQVLAEPQCVACLRLAKSATDLQTKGHRYSTSPFLVESVTEIGKSAPDIQLVRLQLSQPEVEVVDRSGTVVATDAPSKGARTVGVRWKSGAWRLVDMA